MDYRTFLTCTGREAAWCLTGSYDVFPATGRLCGSVENSNLFLCDTCLGYWKACTENRLQAAWEFALERRKNKHEFRR